MNQIFSMILYFEAVLSFYYGTRIFYKANRKNLNYWCFTLTSIGCGLWCLGYDFMLICENEDYYFLARAVDIFGLVLFLLGSQNMLAIMAGIYEKVKHMIYVETLLSIVFVAVMHMRRFVYLEHTKYGIVPYFNNDLVSAFYMFAIGVIIVIYIWLTVVLLNKKNKKSIRALGHFCVAIEVIIITGALLDTILPLLGIEYNLPIATTSAFLGLMILYYALHVMNRNTINLPNTTNYVYKSFGSPMLIFDELNRVKLFNDCAAEVFDISRENIADLDVWKDVFGQEVPTGIQEAVEESIELEIHLESKNSYYNLSIDPIFNDYMDFIGYIVLATDITLNKQYLMESEQSKNEAIAANRSKSMFLANMSHEIRTPMNSILSFSELALQEDMAENLRESFTDIHTSAQSLLSIINDILNVSKIESGKMELNNIAFYPFEVFDEVSVIIKLLAESKGLQFQMQLAEDIPNQLEGDKGKLREILINLLNNSVKYTKAGLVRLEVDCRKGSDGTIQLHAAVKDTGIGIKPEELGNIFSKFKRVDEKINSSTEGTGLGLTITKAFVELMSGQIKVSSVYEFGSCFEFTVPMKVLDASPMQIKKELEQKEEKVLKLKKVSILAVDDNQMNLKVDAKFLKRYGADFKTIDSGPGAIELCSKQDFDLVLMDQMMPGMDGVEAMQEIRKLGGAYTSGGKSKIIALTANVIEGVKEELLGLGFDNFLGKPIDFAEFEKVVTGILSESQYEYVLADSQDAKEAVTSSSTEVEKSETGKAKQTTEKQTGDKADSTKKESTESTEASEDYLAIDKEQGLANFAGEEEDYREILLFLKDTGLDDLAELHDLYEKEDWKNYTIKVHGMKSQCKYIGGMNIGEFARQLEFAGKDNNLEFIRSKEDEFEEAFRGFVEAIPKD